MSVPAGSLRGWGAGARAAGLVVALGYLLGLVRGPLIAVAGGLALVTLGRSVAARAGDDLVLGGALAVLVGALQVGALRWETVDLPRLRGAQAVLGPTVLVGPEAAAAACWVAGLAGVAALAAWLATVRRAGGDAPGRPAQALWIADAGVGALALVTVFWGASVPRGSFGGTEGALALAGWLVAVAVTGGTSAAAAPYLQRSPQWCRRTVVLAGVATVAAGIAIATAGA